MHHPRKAVSSSASIIFLRKKKVEEVAFVGFSWPFSETEKVCVGRCAMLGYGLCGRQEINPYSAFFVCIETQLKLKDIIIFWSNNKSKTSTMAYNFVSKFVFYVFAYIISMINLLKHKFW